MRHVRRIEPLDGVPAQRERVAVGERPWRAVGDVVGGHHGGDLPAHRNRLRRDRQPLVHRAAFIRLEMRVRDVAQPLDGQHALDRLAREGEQPARSRVEQERRVVDDQVLVEVELARASGRSTGVLMR